MLICDMNSWREGEEDIPLAVLVYRSRRCFLRGAGCILAEAPAVMFSCCQGLYLCSRVSSGRLSTKISKQK